MFALQICILFTYTLCCFVKYKEKKCCNGFLIFHQNGWTWPTVFPLDSGVKKKKRQGTHIYSIVFFFLTIILPPSCSFSLFSPHFPPTPAPRLFLSVSPLTHAVRFFSLIHQYTIVQRLPFSDANYLPKWGCEALCLPAQSFIDRSVS